jgi:AcrR family transcriptional regulator
MIPAVPKPRKSAKRRRQGAGRPAACEVAGRREHLLNTATEVFLEFGYENANVSEIADRAGASKRTIYSRYPSKAELFVTVLTRKTLELQESFAETLVSQDSLGKVLEGFAVHLLRARSRPQLRALYKVFIAESPKFPKLASRFWDVGPKRSISMLRDYLLKHPEFKGGNPEHAAEMFWSLCCGPWVVRDLLQNEELMSEKTIRFNAKEAVRVFLSAYTSAPSVR